MLLFFLFLKKKKVRHRENEIAYIFKIQSLVKKKCQTFAHCCQTPVIAIPCS